MGDVVELPKKKLRKPIVIGGVRYIPLEEAASRIGITIKTIYEWNTEGRFPKGVYKYLGAVYYDENMIEAYKKALLQPMRITR